MGINLVFDDKNADLTGIANHLVPHERIFLSEIVQSAWIDVSEDGTNIISTNLAEPGKIKYDFIL